MKFHSTSSLDPHVTASRIFDGVVIVLGSMAATFTILALVLAPSRSVPQETARAVLIYGPCAVGLVALWRVARRWT